MSKSESIPVLSVLMPVHNAAPYLHLAMNSILDQTFQDFEVIAIDDGSDDFSRRILNEYANRDPRIRVFHRLHRGLVPTLNEGIDLARGEWIARMDADDIALKHRFNLQLDLLVRTHSDFCGGAVKCFGDNSAVCQYPESNESCGIQLLFSVPFAHPAVIGRTSAFRELRYDSNYRHAEDYDLWQRAWASGFRLANLPDVVMRYRVHKAQVSYRHSAMQNKMANAVRVRHWLNICPDLAGEKIIHCMFSQGNVDTVSLASVMARALPQIPKTEYYLFMKASLGVFARLARHDSRAVMAWIKLCTFKRKDFRAMVSLVILHFCALKSFLLSQGRIQSLHKVCSKLSC